MPGNLEKPLRFLPSAIMRVGGGLGNWRHLRLGGTFVTLGLAGDFMEPMVGLELNWWGLGICVVALVVGTIFVRGLLRTREKAHQDSVAARVRAFALIGIFVFGFISVLDVAYGGSKGALSEQIGAVANLQNDILQKLTGVEEILERTQETTEQIEANTRKTTAALDRIDQRDEMISTLALLDRVTEAKDMTDRGQVPMIEKLLAGGYNFSGFDLSGVALDGLAVKGANLKSIALTFSRLNDASIIDSDLSGMTARFAEMRSSKFDGSNLANSKFSFVTADNASFRSANAIGASFYSSILRGADLSGADLSGASFQFADLRKARLDDANLSDTLLSGAILEGASFRGTRFDNTDVTGTVIDFSGLTKAQRAGLCERANSGGQARLGVTVIERIPSQRFSGGIENKRIVDQYTYIHDFVGRGLPACKTGGLSAKWFYERRGVEVHDLDFGVAFDTELVGKAGRTRALNARIRAHLELMAEFLSENKPVAEPLRK